MGNYLMATDVQRIKALLELGWNYRRMAKETGVHRDTVARYDPDHVSKPATVSPGSLAKPARVSTGSSACEPFRDRVEKAVTQGLTAQRIWQDLKEDGFGYEYASVKRFVRSIKKRHPEVAGVMEHPPGKSPGGFRPRATYPASNRGALAGAHGYYG